MNIFPSQSFKIYIKGFVLPLTLLICSIILSVATIVSTVLLKGLYFSRLSRDSQLAYYAADAGLMCATTIDDAYTDPVTGLGIFESSNITTADSVLASVNTYRASRGLAALTLYGGSTSIKCGASEIFNPSTSDFSTQPYSRVNSAGNTENGRTSIFTMHMDLGDGTERCAKVTVNKTSTYRQIISQGFAKCVANGGIAVERAVISVTNKTTTDSTNSENMTPNAHAVVLTNGVNWSVPQGVTSIKVWAIGGGGGGAGASYNDNEAGGGGSAGAVVYKTYTVTPGENVSYRVGSGGNGGTGRGDGQSGGQTTVDVNGYSQLVASGGLSGLYNVAGSRQGGSATPATNFGADGGADGGKGSGANGDVGGGGGGAIGYGDSPGLDMARDCNGSTNGGNGANGGLSQDVGGLFAALSVVGGYPVVAAGVGSYCGSISTSGTNDGGNATGFGSGGGGAGYYGGDGGDGLYGGGGGGGSGYATIQKGGKGGDGAVVISW